jgi:ribosomal protein S18 acetylase RimI-like enzyme
MQVTQAAAADLPELLDIMKIGSTGDHTDYIKQSVKTGRCLAAVKSDKVIGFGILGKTIFFGQNFIELLIVRPGYRRQGVATALIRHMEALCSTNKLFTSTNQSNNAAQKTFEANGFIRSGLIENLDEGDPEIIYFKRL